MSCEAFTTESRARPLALRFRRMFPGALARRRLAVMTAQIVVRIELSLKSLDWTMRTGRRNPAAEPAGSPSEAHQISPRRITTPPWEVTATESAPKADRA